MTTDRLGVSDKRPFRCLLQGIGNPARGDDALGPEFINSFCLLGVGSLGAIQKEWIYQLQIEQAEQWSHFDVVVVVDAHAALARPFDWGAVPESPVGLALASHSVSPEQVLALNRALFPWHPRVFQLSLRAESFELGRDLTLSAREALLAAGGFLSRKLANIATQWSEESAVVGGP